MLVDSATVVAFVAILGSIITTSMTMLYSFRERQAGTFETATEGLERTIKVLNLELKRVNSELDDCRKSLADCRGKLWSKERTKKNE